MSIPFMEIERFERRFGTVAVNKGFITAEQLIQALGLQVTEELRNRKHRLVGIILYEQGHITAPQIREVEGEVMEGR